MVTTKHASLQDPFLNALRREKVPVSIYLVNGIKLQGQVEAFDQFVVLLKNNVSQMVYKHAISTIVPGRNVGMKPSGPAHSEHANSAPSGEHHAVAPHLMHDDDEEEEDFNSVPPGNV